jgi:predicted dehydrogenase
MSHKIKLGLIGVQKWGRHVGDEMAASQSVELARLYDVNIDAANKAAERWKSTATTSLAELLASDVLGVVVITPNQTHMEIALDAASAGKHAMIVKPITPGIAEGRELIDAFAKAGVFLAANHPARKSPISRYAKKLIDAGEFGKVVLLANVTGHNGGMRQPPGSWRSQRRCAPGGPLIQLTVHTFDTWQYWFGPIVAIQAAGGHRVTPGDNDDYFAGQARFADGLLGNFATQYAAPGVGFHAIYGTQRTLVTDGEQPYEQRLIAGEKAAWPDVEQAPVELEPYSDVRRDVEDFARDIAAGRQPHASGEDGLRALACVQAAIRSSEQGGAWVKVDDVLGGS